MKTLLVAINASYSHTCLAVYALSAYTNVPFTEFTINQPVGDILRGIEKQKPDIVLFSTYIWNAEITAKIIPDIKKILPGCLIGAGGPEFSYGAKKYLNNLKELDFVMFGEGERALKELCNLSSQNLFDKDDFLRGLQNIKGLFLRDGDSVRFTGERDLICDLSELPFSYSDLTDKNKIYYYESSRGCPYSCSYCLSSVDKRVRFMPLERVYEDLQKFLDAEVPLVKFVDRTYNLKPERYINIWRYILEHHNKITMFHFEIEAEYLSEDALEFLKQVPSGVMQFEIGVQSANKKTLKTINRSENIEKLAENIKRIPRTIHQHLDLIAGLPYEDLESFGKSFNFVMALKPDALQLGFLKILSGTIMEEYAKTNGWQWMENPVYETLSTPYLSYSDILFLKDLEKLVDAFWNSGKFLHTMNYIERNVGFWKFFYDLTKLGQSKGIFDCQRRETFWFEWLSEVYGKENKVLYDLIRYDFVLRGKQGGFPSWYEHRYNKDLHREYLEKNGGVTNARLDFAYSELETFDYNVDAEVPENNPGEYTKLIKYR